nr:aldo/keto reductase [Streptomyces sp. V4I23]
MTASGQAPVVCVQNPYGVDAPGGKDMLQACAERGIAFVPFFSIAGEGREAGGVRGEHDEVHAVARAHGVSPAQVRPAWILRQGEHVLAIPGTGDPEHLVDNVAAGALRLTEEECRILDAIGRRAS